MRSVVIGFALLAHPAPAVTQTTTQSSTKSSSTDSTTSPAALDRIREGVMRDSRITLPDFGVPTFRIEVAQETIKLPGQFDKGNAVGDVRGQYFSNAHQEFLDMSSPTGRPVVAPGGLPVFALVSALKKGFRDREQARIRQQIREELEQIDPDAARRTATPPRN